LIAWRRFLAQPLTPPQTGNGAPLYACVVQRNLRACRHDLDCILHGLRVSLIADMCWDVTVVLLERVTCRVMFHHVYQRFYKRFHKMLAIKTPSLELL